MKYIPIIGPRDPEDRAINTGGGTGCIKLVLGDGWWPRETDNGINPGLGGGGIEGFGG